MLLIDGSFGEGGGQILRTSLALSLVTGKPFRIEKVRAGRRKPGLSRQHLTALEAAAEVGRARVLGAEIGSQEVAFEPDGVRAGEYRFAVGTAGSATLVLQTVLPALVLAEGPSTLVLEGGTHNPFAPPYDFLEKAFLPVLNRMGPRVSTEIDRYGFYPAGGGSFSVSIEPVRELRRIDLLERGEVIEKRARALVARLPVSIAEREVALLHRKFGIPRECCRAEEVKRSPGPGNVVMIEIECEHVTEVVTGFGERGVSAEKVAQAAGREAREFLASDVPVGRHLADQLLIPMALAGAPAPAGKLRPLPAAAGSGSGRPEGTRTGGGRFRTLAPSSHTETNIEIVKRFLDVDVTLTKMDRTAWQVEVRG